MAPKLIPFNQWPGTSASYHVYDKPVLSVFVEFSCIRDKAAVVSCMEAYEEIHQQLSESAVNVYLTNALNGASTAVKPKLLKFVEAVQDTLVEISEGLEMTDPVIVAFEEEIKETDLRADFMFMLEVELKIENGEVFLASKILPDFSFVNEDDRTQETGCFADDLETAFPVFKTAVAENGNVALFRWESISIEAEVSEYIGIRPLSGTYFSKEVQLRKYVSGKPIYDEPMESMIISDADMQAWAISLGDAVDDFLNPGNDFFEGIPLELKEKVTAAKQRIAAWISEFQLVGVLDPAIKNKKAARLLLQDQLNEALSTIGFAPSMLVSVKAGKCASDILLSGTIKTSQDGKTLNENAFHARMNDGQPTSSAIVQVASNAAAFEGFTYIELETDFQVDKVAFPESTPMKVIHPFSAGSPAKMKLPLPLLTISKPPLLASSGATASLENADQIEQFRQWDYSFTYHSQLTVQDALHVQVSAEPVSTSAADYADELFVSLAQFSAPYAAIQADFRADSSADRLAAFQSFAYMADELSYTWSTHRQAPLPEIVGNYRIIEVPKTENDLDSTLAVMVEIETHNGLKNKLVPVVKIDGYTMEKNADTPWDMTSYSYFKTIDDKKVYLKYSERGDYPLHTFVLEKNDILETDQLWASGVISRNENQVWDKTFNPVFIFGSRQVNIDSLEKTSISFSGRDIATFTQERDAAGKASLGTFLGNLLLPLLNGSRSNPVSMECRYVYDADEISGLPIRIPVALVPSEEISQDSIDRVAAAVSSWTATVDLENYQNGRFEFSFDVHSADGTQAIIKLVEFYLKKEVIQF